jgi:hypothetical protein
MMIPNTIPASNPEYMIAMKVSQRSAYSALESLKKVWTIQLARMSTPNQTNRAPKKKLGQY